MSKAQITKVNSRMYNYYYKKIKYEHSLKSCHIQTTTINGDPLLETTLLHLRAFKLLLELFR